MSSTNRDSGAVLRAGLGTPLLLFHGITCSGRIWSPVIPLLSPHHDVIAPSALGHRGGERARAAPTRITHVVDDAERCLDRLGIAQAHLAGNSMGGWVALELARRGRALSVCALSPAGLWHETGRAGRKLEAMVALTRAARFVLPVLALSSRFRRIALRDNAAHGERVSRADFLHLVEDVLGCEAAADLLHTNEALLELRARCPVTLAWSERDGIFPLKKHADLARQRIPEARFLVLHDVGHVPMLDDPQLVARTILQTTASAAQRTAQALV